MKSNNVYVSSINEASKKIVKGIGYGTESTVGLLKNNKRALKVFKQPLDLSEKQNLLIGKDLVQDSYVFFDKVYANNDFIFAAECDYINGEKMDSNIINTPLLKLNYATHILKRDTKIISDNGIITDDIKPFNTLYTDDYIKIVDTTRFEYSSKDKNELYRYNLEMVFSMIRNCFNNDFLQFIFEKEKDLKKEFYNNEKFPFFFIDLQDYIDEKSNNPINTFGKYVKNNNNY